MHFERRTTDLEVRIDEAASKVTGYAAVFNRTSHDVGGFKERIAPGAFSRVLGAGVDVLGLFNHDVDHLLATRSAGTLRLEENDKGLKYEFDLDPSDPDHQRVLSKIKRGDLKGSSFAFRTNTKTDEWTADDDGYPLRTVTEVSALRDVGPVTAPAYAATEDIDKKLALRGLADQLDTPVDELVRVDLKAFLERKAEDSSDSADASAQKDEAADERITPSPLPDPPKWHSNYQKGS